MSATDLHFQPSAGDPGARRIAREPEQDAPPAKAARKQSRGRAYRVGMKWTRRIHLWSGLFLVPWVVLYGVSAYLFNHPISTRHEIDPGALRAAAVADAVSPDRARALAEQIVGTINEDQDNAAPIQLSGTPEFAGQFSFRGQSERHQLFARVDPSTNSGSWSSRPVRATLERANFLPTDKVRVGAEARDATKASVKAILQQTAHAGTLETSSPDAGTPNAGELELDQWSLRSAPTLQFDIVDAESKPLTLRYDVVRQDLSAQPRDRADFGSAMSWRRFALRLHTAHTYPSRFGVRFMWAILVDAMAVAMVAWALSGVLMWWQIRTLRRMGIAVGIASLIVAAWLAFGMHAAFLD